MLLGYFTSSVIMVFVSCYSLFCKIMFHIQFDISIFSKFTASVDVDKQLLRRG